MTHKRPRRRFGFTLVEMLVVIVIIGVLIALLVPVITSAVRTVRDAQVSADINAMANAMATFQGEVRRISAQPDHPDGERLLRDQQHGLARVRHMAE